MSNKKIKITGGNPLSGEVKVSGAKNSVLGLMIASSMTSGVVTLEDVPKIKDVELLIDTLEFLGANTITAQQGDKTILAIDNEKLEYKDLIMEEVASFRASYYFMGAMIARFKKCRLAFPGGCFLGPRPIDLHVKAFESMGCDIFYEDIGEFSVINIEVKDKLRGERIFLDFPSVGATINIMLAATMAEGETVIENAAKEPEIVDVATLLNNMGVRISGAGTDEIIIQGVDSLHGCFHQVVPDRIEAGTYLMIGSILGEPGFTVSNIIPEHLDALVSKLQDIGIHLEIGDEQIKIVGRNDVLSPVKIKTGVYPSFATDFQQVFVTLLTQVEGSSRVVEAIYPERFRQCSYLDEMGAQTLVTTGEEVGSVDITGQTSLTGKEVMATDLRAGASLVFAGLIAEGETIVNNINHILRGYDDIVGKLSAVGATIELIEEE